MAPKKPAAEYWREWRQFVEQHGKRLVEHLGSPGYRLAKRIRMALAKGKFTLEDFANVAASLHNTLPPTTSDAATAARGKSTARP